MEITDDKLLKIALITSLIGLIGLIIFTPSIEVKKVEIQDINRGMMRKSALTVLLATLKPQQVKAAIF